MAATKQATTAPAEAAEELAPIEGNGASASFYSMKVRTEFGDVMFHVDANAGQDDLDAMHMLVTTQIDALREMETEEGGAYFVRLGTVANPGAGGAAPPSGIVCGKCGSGDITDNRGNKTNPRAPDMKCNACYAVVWPGKNGQWAAGRPPQ